MLNVNCKMQNMKFVIELQNTSVRFEIIDSKCKIPNVEWRMSIVKFKMQNMTCELKISLRSVRSKLET